MIKFFRHIRRSLINSNQMVTYFKYAIGEILLVVIGILIALGINIWNENRKKEKNEIILLEKLQEENTINLGEVKRDSTYRENLPKLMTRFNTFLKNGDLKLHKDSLQDYLAEIMRCTSYSFNQNNIVNYINSHESNASDITKELAILKGFQDDLQTISNKGIDIRFSDFFNTIKADVDFNSGEIINYDKFKSLKFRNDINILLGIDREISNQFNSTLRQIRLVDSLITEQLER